MTIDAKMLSKMFLSGARNLEAKKEWINELNVFPVPDGDTGTNMSMTILSAASEVSSLGQDVDMDTLCKAISSGSLRGARGNSGVILSQLLRGLTRTFRTETVLDPILIAKGFERAVETAYKAVMKPKEGTILTVAREAALTAADTAADTPDLETFFRGILASAEETLQKTPEMLPVLKEAGVVDSGGQGLVEVLRGAFDAYMGKEIDYSSFTPSGAPKVLKISKEAEEEIKFGYCTECIVLLNRPLSDDEVHEFKAFLNSIGDSIVLVADDELVKIHVHTNHPGQVFEKGLTYGALSRIKVDNMREEHQEKLFKDSQKLAKEQAEADAARENAGPRKDTGFIAVAAGEGLSDIFRDLGADYIIEGGQTMNPSTEDMLNAIARVNADHIYILPNNKNIILAANQAQELTDDKDILVVPTRTIPQGITAMISYEEGVPADENLRIMSESASNVKTGQVTYAVRDTRLDEKDIHEGDFMGIGDSGILSAGREKLQVALETVDSIVSEDTEILSVYYGEDITEEEAELFRQKISESFPDIEVEVNYGGQPVYYYIISAE